MKLIQIARHFVVLLILVLIGVVAQGKDFDEKAIDIIYAHDRYNPESRKSVYKLMKVQIELQKFQDDPDKYRTPRFSKMTDKIEGWDPMTAEQVRDQAWNRATIDVEGTNLSDQRFFQTATDWVALVPAVGGVASVASKSLGSLVDKSGSVPSMEDVVITGLGGILNQQMDPVLLQNFLSDYERGVGHTLEKADENPLVIHAKNIADQEQAFADVKASVEELKQWQAEQSAKQLDAEKKEEIRKAFEKKRDTVLGTISATSQALQILGHGKAADSFDKFGKIVDISMKLQNEFDDMNPIMMTNFYLMAANIAISMFSNDSGPEKQMMEMMQEILKQIEDLKAEMNDRFERVDRKLADIIETININDALNRERQEKLRGQLNEIQDLVAGLYEKIDDGTIADVRRRVISTVEQNCINTDPEKAFFLTYSNQEFNQNCVNPLIQLASGDLTFQNLNLSFVPADRIDWGGRFDRPYQKHFPSILKRIADYRLGSAISFDAIAHSVNAELWDEMSWAFVNLFDQSYMQNPVFSDRDFGKVISGGEDLLSLYKNLLLENGKLRWDLIELLISEYETLITEAAYKVKELALSPAPGELGFDGSGFDVTQGLDQPTNFTLSGEQRTLKFCNNVNKNGGLLYIGWQSEVGQPVVSKRPGSWNEMIEGVKMVLPNGFEREVLPKEYLWLAKKYPAQFQMCVETMAIPSYQDTNILSTGGVFQTKVGVLEEFTSLVKINVLFNGKIATSVTFQDKQSVRSQGERYFVQFLYRRMWNGYVGSRDSYIKFGAPAEVNLPNIFSNLSKAKQDFVENTDSKVYKELETFLVQNFLNPLESKAISHLQGVALAEQAIKLDGYLKFMAAIVNLGLNDRVSLKRELEKTLTTVVPITTPEGTQNRYGLFDVNQMIYEIIYKNWDENKIDAVIQEAVGSLRMAFQNLENSGEQLMPAGPLWLNQRLMELKIRRSHLKSWKSKN